MIHLRQSVITPLDDLHVIIWKGYPYLLLTIKISIGTPSDCICRNFRVFELLDSEEPEGNLGIPRDRLEALGVPWL